MTTVCIMQPTYLPWVGYFDMLDQADVFVLLDTVAFASKSWQQRNRIRLPNGKAHWLTVPAHAHRGQAIKDVEIANEREWLSTHWGTIEQAYKKTPGWDALVGWLYVPFDRNQALLADFTSGLIGSLARCLGIDTPIVRASSLGSTRAGKVERIIDICRAVDADVLLDTPGAQAFLTDTMLEPIRIDWHRYQPAHYSQGDQPWHPHLSVIDLIAWHGTDALSIIKQGRKTSAPPLAIGSE